MGKDIEADGRAEGDRKVKVMLHYSDPQLVIDELHVILEKQQEEIDHWKGKYSNLLKEITQHANAMRNNQISLLLSKREGIVDA